MNEAAKSFSRELTAVDIKDKKITLYSNMTAQPYSDDVIGLLSNQICNPVQWENLIRNMTADGIDTFIEIGPGKTLTNMIKKIVPEVTALSVTEYLSEVESC